MKPKKTEVVGVRLNATQKEFLDKMAHEIGCPPSALACKALTVWLEACEQANGYISPQYSTIPNELNPVLLDKLEALLATKASNTDNKRDALAKAG